jgi:hypothetical protein
LGRRGVLIAHFPNKTYALLGGGELQFAKNYLRGLDLNVWLADRDRQFTLTSPAPNVIDIADRANAGKKMEFTLDPATFLPVKNSAISISDTGQPIAQEMHLELWTPSRASASRTARLTFTTA